MGYANTKDKLIALENILAIQEFVDVFPEDMLRLRPKRSIDFTIELIPGATLVLKAAYRMSILELIELKIQLQQLLDKGHIRPSVALGGTGVVCKEE